MLRWMITSLGPGEQEGCAESDRSYDPMSCGVWMSHAPIPLCPFTKNKPKRKVCYVWDAAAFMATGALRLLDSFSYSGQGWGLCSHRGKLVMSSDSTTLVERDPATFEVTREFTVRM